MLRSPFPDHVQFFVASSAALRRDELEENLRKEERQIADTFSRTERRIEFMLGRYAAHRALEGLGLAGAAVTKRTTREPLWPAGIVGAITHCNSGNETISCAAVARTERARGVGVDLEDLRRRCAPGLVKRLCTEPERSWVEAAPVHSHERLLSLFSAKETLFKAVYPLTGVYLGFHDAEVTWMEEKRCFDTRVKRSLGPHFSPQKRFSIRCERIENLVLTSLLIPA